jgi:hypothetical protein
MGQSARLLRTLTVNDIQAFAAVSGDTNPAHLNAEYASDTLFHGVSGHGMWSGALISALLGTQFPGTGTIYLDQALQRAYAITNCLLLSIADARSVYGSEVVKNAREGARREGARREGGERGGERGERGEGVDIEREDHLLEEGVPLSSLLFSSPPPKASPSTPSFSASETESLLGRYQS